MCCVISCILKCLLGIVASLLMVIGIVVGALGALLLWGFNLLLQGINDQITKILANIPFKGDWQSVVNLISSNTSAIGAIAFAIGVVLVAFSILMIVAMCCCSVRLLLIVIVILLSALTVGLIVVLAFYGSNPTYQIFTPLQAYMQTGLINKYVSDSATNPESMIVNVLQMAVQCCGINNYTDFNNVTTFNRTIILYNTVLSLPFPKTCCNYARTGTIDPTTLNNCIINGTSTIKEKGCWALAVPYLTQYLTYCFTTVGVTIAVLVLVIVVLILFICCLDKMP